MIINDLVQAQSPNYPSNFRGYYGDASSYLTSIKNWTIGQTPLLPPVPDAAIVAVGALGVLGIAFKLMKRRAPAPAMAGWRRKQHRKHRKSRRR